MPRAKKMDQWIIGADGIAEPETDVSPVREIDPVDILEAAGPVNLDEFPDMAAAELVASLATFISLIEPGHIYGGRLYFKVNDIPLVCDVRGRDDLISLLRQFEELRSMALAEIADFLGVDDD